MQISTLDCKEYFPAAQGVHTEALAEVLVSVMFPGGQRTQGSEEPLTFTPPGPNFPAMHATHALDAVVELCVLPETESCVCDPFVHSLHAMVDTGLNFPGEQTVHEVADTLLRVFVVDPAGQASQASLESLEN